VLTGEPQKINPIKLPEDNPNIAPQSHKYTTKSRIDKASTLEDIFFSADMNYDWKYYSERKGWDDSSISAMKKLLDDILEFGKKEGWDLDVKFNRRYCAIQTKNKYNIFVLKERNDLIRIEYPALGNKDEPPNSDPNWKWSESQGFWQGNFAYNELVKVDDIKDILRKSYNLRE